MQAEVIKALKILKDGGIILYPTDTIWGLGCDATNQNAIQKIYKIKQREDDWYSINNYEFKKEFWKDHPYSLSKIGELSSLQNISKKENKSVKVFD